MFVRLPGFFFGSHGVLPSLLERGCRGPQKSIDVYEFGTYNRREAWKSAMTPRGSCATRHPH